MEHGILSCQNLIPSPRTKGERKRERTLMMLRKAIAITKSIDWKTRTVIPVEAKKGRGKKHLFPLSLSPYPENMHQSHQFSRVQSLLSFSLHIATTTWLVGMWRGGLTSSTCILEWRERGKSPLKGGTKHHIVCHGMRRLVWLNTASCSKEVVRCQELIQY